MILRIVHAMYDFAEERLGHLSPVIKAYVVCVVIYLLDRLQVACLFAMVHAQCLVVAWTTNTDSASSTCAATPTPTGIISNDLSVFHFATWWRTNELLVLISNARQGRIFQIYVILILVILVWVIKCATKVRTQVKILPLGLRPANCIALQCTLELIGNQFIFCELIRLALLVILHVFFLCGASTLSCQITCLQCVLIVKCAYVLLYVWKVFTGIFNQALR